MFKSENQKKIVLHIIKNGITSRKDLASIIGVSSAGITKITNSLILEGILRESGNLLSDNVGRKSIGLEIVNDYKYLVGIEISNRSMSYTITSLDLKVIKFEKFDYRWVGLSDVSNFLEHFDSVIKNFDIEKIIGIGLVVQGYVKNNIAYNIEVSNIYQIIKERYSVDVQMSNNISALASYEQIFGNKKDDFLMVKYGPGVGASLVMDGKVYLGNNLLAGEIGHINWDNSQGAYCKVCKKYNCLEADINYENMLKKMNVTSNEVITSKLFLQICEEDGLVNLKLAFVKLAKIINIVMQIVGMKELILVGSILDDDKYFEIFQKILNDDVDGGENIIVSRVSDSLEKRKLVPCALLIGTKFTN